MARLYLAAGRWPQALKLLNAICAGALTDAQKLVLGVSRVSARIHCGEREAVVGELETLVNACPEGSTEEKLAYYEACATLAFLLILNDQVAAGWQHYAKAVHCQQGETLKPLNLGRVASKYLTREEVRRVIITALEFRTGLPLPAVSPVPLSPAETQQELTVLCVKVGRKYSAEYVNKLYRGVKRHFTALPFSFVCLTDDPSDLDPGVTPELISAELPAWWSKVLLFRHPTASMKLYIDLDVVVTGDINVLSTYEGSFLLVGASSISCEDCKDGYNSSLLLWRGDYQRIYTSFLTHQHAIFDVIDRLDHWLQALLPSVDTVQDRFPGLCKDFCEECREAVPEHCGLVIFPQSPKPHECTAAWVQQLWV